MLASLLDMPFEFVVVAFHVMLAFRQVAFILSGHIILVSYLDMLCLFRLDVSF